MANGGFGAFGQAAFFQEGRDIRKQREEERATSVREGLDERRVAAAERQVGLQERGLGLQEGAAQREGERIGLERERVDIARGTATRAQDTALQAEQDNLAESFGSLLAFKSGAQGVSIRDVRINPDDPESQSLLQNGIDNLMGRDPSLSALEAEAMIIDATIAGQQATRQAQTPVGGFFVDLDNPQNRLSTQQFNALPPQDRQRFSFIPAQVAASSVEGAFGGTSRTQSVLEEDILKNQNALSNLANLSELMAQARDQGVEVFGFEGFIDGLVNSTLAQFDPAFFNQNRAEIEETIGVAVESMLRSVSDDDRFNREDRAAITALFPGTGAFDTAPEAEIKMRVLGNFFATKFGISSQARGPGGAPLVNRDQFANDVARLFLDGRINRATADRLLAQ